MTVDADPRIRRPVPDRLGAPRPLPLLRRLAGERAAERTARVLAFGFLPGGVVFGVLLAPVLADQATFWPGWWTSAAVVLLVAPPVAFGALAFTVPLPVIRALAAVSAIGTLLVLATAPIALLRPHALAGPSWIDQVAALGLIASVLAVRAGRAVLVAVVGSTLTSVLRLTSDAADAQLDALQNGAYVLLFTVSFIALGVSSLATARAADAAEDAAAEAATRAAVDAARDREQARINGLVHDRVLATLLTAARRLPGSEEVGRRDARRALEGLHALLSGERPPDTRTDAQGFVWRAQGVTTELAPEAVFGYDLLADREVPGEVADALLTATEEALRNSLRHAGAANRTVHVVVSADRVEVHVLDDGVGFDPAAVPPARLGIAQSIEARVRALAGGAATVISESGVGTRVVVGWSGS